MVTDPTQRFSERAANYVRCRPGYPEALVKTIEREVGLTPASVVADVGSGTGISTELFLRLGCTVLAVEPNAAMREAAEERLAHHARFHSVDAPAETTTLPDASVDLVAAAQAFHWFDVGRARTEFARILRPAGSVALFWNTRSEDATPFLRDYEALLQRFATDYAQVDHRKFDEEALAPFFAGEAQLHAFPNEQLFDLEGLRGRLLSASYAPLPGHANHPTMLRELDRIFAEHEVHGQVRFEYEAKLFLGRVRR